MWAHTVVCSPAPHLGLGDGSTRAFRLSSGNGAAMSLFATPSTKHPVGSWRWRWDGSDLAHWLDCCLVWREQAKGWDTRCHGEAQFNGRNQPTEWVILNKREDVKDAFMLSYLEKNSADDMMMISHNVFALMHQILDIPLFVTQLADFANCRDT